jgi:hypothetical protein
MSFVKGEMQMALLSLDSVYYATASAATVFAWVALVGWSALK